MLQYKYFFLGGGEFKRFLYPTGSYILDALGVLGFYFSSITNI